MDKKTRTGKFASKTKEIKVYIMLSGKTIKIDIDFFNTLSPRFKLSPFKRLKGVPTVDESDIVVVFCPIVSRAGTDIEAALKRFDDSTDSKLKVLVVLHHTFDPEKTVQDSSRCVKRTDILTVDCLYYEDTGLLECQKNHEAGNKVVDWLIQQREEIGDNVHPHQNKSAANSFHPYLSQKMKPKSPSDNTDQMRYSIPVKYSVISNGDTHVSDVDFLDALNKQNPSLMCVSEEQESDVILHFYPVCNKTDFITFLENYKKTDKPVVLICLHNTLDTESIPSKSGCARRPGFFIVDCAFIENFEGLPDCQRNQKAVTAVSDWINTKMT